MSKNMNIYAELDNFVEENKGQVTLTDVAKHFTEYGYQYAIEHSNDVIGLIVRMSKKDIAFTKEEAVKFYHKEMEE